MSSSRDTGSPRGLNLAQGFPGGRNPVALSMRATYDQDHCGVCDVWKMVNNAEWKRQHVLASEICRKGYLDKTYMLERSYYASMPDPVLERAPTPPLERIHPEPSLSLRQLIPNTATYISPFEQESIAAEYHTYPAHVEPFDSNASQGQQDPYSNLQPEAHDPALFQLLDPIYGLVQNIPDEAISAAFNVASQVEHTYESLEFNEEWLPQHMDQPAYAEPAAARWPADMSAAVARPEYDDRKNRGHGSGNGGGSSGNSH